MKIRTNATGPLRLAVLLGAIIATAAPADAQQMSTSAVRALQADRPGRMVPGVGRMSMPPQMQARDRNGVGRRAGPSGSPASIRIPSNARRVDRTTIVRRPRASEARHRDDFGVIDGDWWRDDGIVGVPVRRVGRPASDSGFARAQLRFSHAATATGNQLRVEAGFGRAQLRTFGINPNLSVNRGVHAPRRIASPSRGHRPGRGHAPGRRGVGRRR